MKDILKYFELVEKLEEITGVQKTAIHDFFSENIKKAESTLKDHNYKEKEIDLSIPFKPKKKKGRKKKLF